jgi:hypothetical protein
MTEPMCQKNGCFSCKLLHKHLDTSSASGVIQDASDSQTSTPGVSLSQSRMTRQRPSSPLTTHPSTVDLWQKDLSVNPL